jgi:uncharacterized membrane protein YfcA
MTLEFSFYLIAIPAVILVGLSKGGLGGALALIGVPLMSLVIPPVQAAAIFLPILIVMDLVALWAWRHHNHRETLIKLLPGAMIGLSIGWATASIISADALKLVLGTVTILFVAKYVFDLYRIKRGIALQPAKQNSAKATIWGTLSGYASFVAHAGGPPFSIYALPLQLEPKSFTGMSTRYFAILNAVKVIPYFALGALDTTNLTASATLLPVAMVATLLGAKVIRYIRTDIFYPIMYSMTLLAAVKLVWDAWPFG